MENKNNIGKIVGENPIKHLTYREKSYIMLNTIN